MSSLYIIGCSGIGCSGCGAVESLDPEERVKVPLIASGKAASTNVFLRFVQVSSNIGEGEEVCDEEGRTENR